MRLHELFYQRKLTEAPTGGPDQIISAPTGQRVVSISLADIFMMTVSYTHLTLPTTD